jgi:uncharacterized membrane protein YphA (DoxX/SURF4 family)
MERDLAVACQPVLMSHPVRWLGLIMLCAAYLQGALMRFYDFGGAVAEMEKFGLTPARPVAALIILIQIGASVMVVTGFWRWIGALMLAAFTIVSTLIAFHFWSMPPGLERDLAANIFFEHLGLAGGFLLVSWYSLHKWRRGERDWT